MQVPAKSVIKYSKWASMQLITQSKKAKIIQTVSKQITHNPFIHKANSKHNII